MRSDVAKWARECLECQRAKVTRNTVQPIGEFTVPSKRFDHWNVDIVSMPPSNGCRYLLTGVDRLSRWPIAVPLPDITATAVADAFAFGIVSNFGVPSSITTDNGSQFSSALWTQLMRTWGIKSHFTTAYHPESNGLVERFHRRLKESLIALGSEEPNDWFWRLPCSLLSIRTTLKPDIGSSPADLVYGEGLAVPGTLLQTQPPTEQEEAQIQPNLLNNLRLEVARLQPTATSAHRRPRIYVPDELRRASHVLVRRGGTQPALNAPYTGPHRVISREESSFRIAMPGGRAENISISRLRPAVMPTDDQDLDITPPTPPSPPRPGRRPRNPTNPPPPSTRRTRSAGHLNDSSNDDLDQRLERLRNRPAAPDNEPNEDDRSETPAHSPPARNRRRRRGAPNIADFNRLPPNPPVALQSPPASPQPSVEDPHDGHTPPNENLAACPCDPPAGPCTAEPRRFTSKRQRTFSNRGGPVPQLPSNNNLPPNDDSQLSPNVGQRPQPPRLFSKPKPGNFSYQRKKPDVNAVRQILLTLND